MGNFGLSDSDFGFEASDCRIGDFVGFGFGSDWNLCSDSDSDFGLNQSDRIDEKLISDPTGNTS